MRPTVWEYHLEPIADLDRDLLNALDIERWELVTVLPDSGEAVFKRPAPDLRERVTMEQRERVEREREGSR